MSEFKTYCAITFEWDENAAEVADFTDEQVAKGLAAGYGLTPTCHCFTSVTERSYTGETVTKVRFFVGISDDAVVRVDMHPPVELVDILHGEKLRWYTLNPSATRESYGKAVEADFDLSGDNGNG